MKEEVQRYKWSLVVVTVLMFVCLFHGIHVEDSLSKKLSACQDYSDKQAEIISVQELRMKNLETINGMLEKLSLTKDTLLYKYSGNEMYLENHPKN